MPGLAPPAHRSRRVAVVVLDIISDYRFKGGSKVLKAIQAQARTLQRFLGRARAARIPVIYVNDNLGHWTSDFPTLKRQAARSSAAVAQLLQALGPTETDFVILKPRHSAFYGTPLEALLEKLRISNLVLAGISTENCIWITACDAHTRGFRLIAPADTMAGLSTKAVSASLTGFREVLGAQTPRAAASLRFGRKCLASGPR